MSHFPRVFPLSTTYHHHYLCKRRAFLRLKTLYGFREVGCLAGSEHTPGFRRAHCSVSTALGLIWGGKIATGFNQRPLCYVGRAAIGRSTPEGEDLGASTVAFHTHLQLLCFPLVRKLFIYPHFTYLSPCCTSLCIRIKNLALSQLGKILKVKYVHLGWDVGVPSRSHFSKWPLNTSGAGFIFICRSLRGSDQMCWVESPFVSSLLKLREISKFGIPQAFIHSLTCSLIQQIFDRQTSSPIVDSG